MSPNDFHGSSLSRIIKIIPYHFYNVKNNVVSLNQQGNWHIQLQICSSCKTMKGTKKKKKLLEKK